MRPLPLALILALACTLPGLGLPLMLDDWFHHAVLEAWAGRSSPPIEPYFHGWAHPTGQLSLFSFFRGEAGNAAHIASGKLPWWTEPDLSIRFLRPLSTLSHVIDQALFGRSPFGPHVVSLGWYLALIAVVSRVYRPLGTGLVGLLALAMFAVDDGHWFPTSWLANRNALIASVFALLGFLAHRRWQEQGWRPGLPLSVLGLVLGLLAGETALSVLGLWVAWQVFASPRGQRARGLLPLLAVVMLWQAVFMLGDYGARGSGLYIDPSQDPVAFASAALVRGPVLAGGLILGLPVDLYFFWPPSKGGLVVGGLGAMGLLALALRRAWPDLEEPVRRELRWMVPGAILATLPALSTFPLGRMLLVPGVAGFGVLAVLLARAWRTRRVGVVALLGLPHLALAPLAWWGMDARSYEIQDRFETLIESVAIEPDRPALLLPVPDPSLAIYLPVTMMVDGRALPSHWLPLSMSPGAHVLERIDADSLRIEALEGAMGHAFFESLFRDFARSPMHAGHTVRSGVMQLTVEADDGGYPTAWRIDLDMPVEELSLLHWQGEHFVALDPPEPGERIEIAHHRGPMGL